MSSIVQRFRYIWHHPANRHRQLSAVMRAAGWQIDKHLRGRHRDVPLAGGMRVRCYPDSQSATLLLYCNGLYDYDEMRFVQDYLRPGDRFLDIGANVGIYSLLASSIVGSQGQVDAFEPVAATLPRLRENLQLNGVENVRVHELAVGSESGVVRFETGQDAMNHMVADPPRPTDELLEPTPTRPQHGKSESKPDCVPCVALDEYLQGQEFALAKIDIEGAEPLAFQGAQRMLRSANPPVWLLEINGLTRRFGFTQQQLEDLLADHGFDLARYDSDRRQLIYGQQLWRDHDNLLAIARSERQHVADRIAAAASAT